MSKICSILNVLIFTALFQAQASDEGNKLSSADSLFALGKYTESYTLYSELYNDDGRYSPQMLLKLAYITEGLGEYEKGLYYLQSYYRKTFDDLALDKMQKLSETYGLAGYERNDLNYVRDKIGRYFNEIVYTLLLIQSFLLLLIAYKKYRLKSKPLYSLVSSMLVILTLFVVINFFGEDHNAIIAKNNAYLMKGPSAGSDLMTIVDKGHKVTLLDKGEVWSQIKLNGDIVFIRSNHLLLL
ncbi:MAG: hypothetical protein RIF33_18260 [Cyclobacteriaceae bacterium]